MSATDSMRLRRAETKIRNVSQELQSSFGMKCDVYYPLIPSAPSRTEHFEDMGAALSNYCLNNMLYGNPEYSNIILWTMHTSMTSPSKVQQSFTVLPNYLKPDRYALGTTYQWAIIVFRNGPAPSRVPCAVRQEEKALQATVAKIVNMGYHVDVWTKSDNYSWREAKLEALGTGDYHGPDQSLREKYQAMVSHGIPGFSCHEIQTFDEMLRIRDPSLDSADSESASSEIALQSRPTTEDDPGCGSDCESEFGGFLEHQEESILPDGSETQFKLYDDSHISGVSEDLDMAARLGGKTVA
ncbi:hypothetical protein SLS64_005323 [Diaporthe eres]|uniref:Uncharacterized protein n=1 Tax=Diaporthe eres TaxID=83184 RepID=A0ABR1PB46_DIAER